MLKLLLVAVLATAWGVDIKTANALRSSTKLTSRVTFQDASFSDIKTWTVDDVKAYATARSKSSDCSIGFNNNLNRVLSFIEDTGDSSDGNKQVTGIRLVKLLTDSQGNPNPDPQNPRAATELKALAKKKYSNLWNGRRWMDFLQPIIDLQAAPKGTLLKLPEGGPMSLQLPKSVERAVDVNRMKPGNGNRESPDPRMIGGRAT